MAKFTSPATLFEDIEPDLSLQDGQARFDAIHPFHSFIVQAPAGSGKTALLTQRFLALLSQVETPEQIIAMTFTKKAAAEMQERIFQALQFGASPLKPDAGIFERNTWYLAKAALENSHRREWQLLQNPHRLRIRTLDSMNSYLVQQMPLLSRFGGQSELVEQPETLYAQAAREAMNADKTTEAVTSLFSLVNGNLKRAETLLSNMLAKRDQWMPLIGKVAGDPSIRTQFDRALRLLVDQEFERYYRQLSSSLNLLEEVRLIAVSVLQTVGAEQLESNDVFLDRLSVLDLKQNLPGGVDLDGWKQLAGWLLKADGDIRKTVNVKNGFPGKTADEKELKKRMTDCLSALIEQDTDKHLSEAFKGISTLPEPAYSDAQWYGIQDLMALLKTAAGYLKVAFAQNGQTDFIEVAQAASEALGSELEPTDLAQRLDYQLKHLLIDEFQDTSVSQFELLKKMVAGWTEDDNHSLFIVGDPMQSIYRFREAEVGNFLEAWQGQLGQVVLERRNLTVNFRSEKGVVDWINRTFKSVLAPENRIEKGAVCYTPSQAFSQNDQPAVETHWQLNQSTQQEVERVVDLIRQGLKTLPEGETIGVLGRSRSHLMPIAEALKHQGISFRAVDLETLSDRQEIQDIQALTRALLHLGDRPAWLALLRSPTIGMSLKDLHVLLGDPETFRTPVYQLLVQQAMTGFEGFSPEGKLRIHRVWPILQAAIDGIGEQPWSRLVAEVWLALDMAAAVESEAALQNIEAYWQMLARLETNQGRELSFSELESALEKLFALPDDSPESQKVELMTMHKSKGLEFDTVILPSLGKTARSDDKPLLSWLNFKTDTDDYLVMAPLDQKGQSTSDLVAFIQAFEREKQDYETGRLLYVAATRAKKRLHLLGSIQLSEKLYADILEEKAELSPPNRSLLSCLWTSQQAEFKRLLKAYEFAETEVDDVALIPKISRLSLETIPFTEHFDAAESGLPTYQPHESAKVQSDSQAMDEENHVYQDSGDEQEALFVTSIGNLVHAVLEQWVDLDEQSLDRNRVLAQMDYYAYWLALQGLQGDKLNEALERVKVSLLNAVENPKVRWALRDDHEASETEWPLSSFGLRFSEQDRLIQHHVIDRTFIDEQGIRWIIDYKTSFWTEGAKVSQAEFIAEQVAGYRPQLERYAELFNQMESRPQKKILYFSYLDEWVEV